MNIVQIVFIYTIYTIYSVHEQLRDVLSVMEDEDWEYGEEERRRHW